MCKLIFAPSTALPLARPELLELPELKGFTAGELLDVSAFKKMRPWIVPAREQQEDVRQVASLCTPFIFSPLFFLFTPCSITPKVGVQRRSDETHIPTPAEAHDVAVDVWETCQAFGLFRRMPGKGKTWCGWWRIFCRGTGGRPCP